jgi:GNAT superfamily N-acetyltransferase
MGTLRISGRNTPAGLSYSRVALAIDSKLIGMAVPFPRLSGDRSVSTTGATIRPAEPHDLPLVLELVLKKAAFDGVPDSVQATERLLHEHLFGSAPAAHVLLGELDGRVAGFASYYLTFSTFLGRPGIWLDDLFVEETVRGHGVGAALLAHLVAMADARGMGRIEWLVATGNTRGLAFYQRHDARVHEEVPLLRLEPQSSESR